MKKLQELILKYPNTALILIISIVYLYFQTDMLLRTTGDEKTYVAQALEMQASGNWFVQTWANMNDYYKGPLHLILLKIGFYIFGEESMFATLYMNYFGLIAATLLLYNLFQEELDDKSWAIFYASSFSLGMGLYAHMFASQMEAELVIAYAVVLYFLNKIDTDRSLITSLLLWSAIGIAGWLKSPAYSVFLTLSVLIYWVLSSQIKDRLRDRITWISLFFGIMVGLGGYIPILIFDGETFIQKYIIKESLGKGANGVTWESAFFPLFTYYLAPWMFAAVFSFFVAIYSLFSKSSRLLTDKEFTLVKLGISITVPTLLFFTIHPYRSEIYALPAVSATMLITFVYWRAYNQRYEKIYIWMMRLSAIVLSIIPAAIVALVIRMSPMPEWWPEYLVYFALVGGLATLLFVFYQSKKVVTDGPALLILSFIPLFIMLGVVLKSFGKAEMQGISDYIEKNNISQPIGYYNLQLNVWNEYGYLNFWIKHKVIGLHMQETMIDFLNNGGIVIIPGEYYLQEFKDKLSFKPENLDIQIWKRWLTHGKTQSGQNRFSQYSKTKDISTIQQDFYIVKLKE